MRKLLILFLIVSCQKKPHQRIRRTQSKPIYAIPTPMPLPITERYECIRVIENSMTVLKCKGINLERRCVTRFGKRYGAYIYTDWCSDFKEE